MNRALNRPARIPDLGDAPAPLPDVPGGEDADALPAVVYVNHGRWLAECPDCRDAYLVTGQTRGDPPGLDRSRWFWCQNCRNAAVRHLLRPVVWPAPEDLEEIAAALKPRPLQNRNWWPWEPIAQLRAENIEHLGLI